MNRVRGYLDLCFDIELIKSELRMLRRQKEEIENKICGLLGWPAFYKPTRYHELKIDSKYKQPSSLEALWLRYEELEKQIREKERELKALEYRKKNIDKIIGQMDSLKHKVAVLREMQGKSLAEIADELGYSEGYIKNLSAEISRELYD